MLKGSGVYEQHRHVSKPEILKCRFGSWIGGPKGNNELQLFIKMPEARDLEAQDVSKLDTESANKTRAGMNINVLRNCLFFIYLCLNKI